MEEKMAMKLKEKRRKLEKKLKKTISEENWQYVKDLCWDGDSITKASADWSELVYKLVQELRYNESGACLSIIQNGVFSTSISDFDKSKEALLLFGTAAEDVYVYQPERITERISEENWKGFKEFIKQKGYACINDGVEVCFFGASILIDRLIEENQFPRKQESYYAYVIQDGEFCMIGFDDLSEFDSEILFLFKVGAEVEIYCYHPKQ